MTVCFHISSNSQAIPLSVLRSSKCRVVNKTTKEAYVLLFVVYLMTLSVQRRMIG